MNTQSTDSTDNSTRQRQHALKSASGFAKVKDRRGQDIRGLWVRGQRFYAQLKVENPLTGDKRVKRIPLIDKDSNPVQTIPQAREELARLCTHRADNMLRNLDRTPKLANYVPIYLDAIAAGEGAKARATVGKEKTILARWIDFIGQLRLDQIKRIHVNRFITARQKQKDSKGNPKVCNRTINLDVIALRCVLKYAMNEGLIQRLPMEGMKPLPETDTERPLFTTADLEKLCKAAFETKKDKQGQEVPITQNAQQFVDYIKLMAYSGCRRCEALGLKWDDVDIDNGQLHVRRQVTHRGIESLKNGEERTVDFNAKLRAHLDDMASRLVPDSDWVFPSPQRGDKDTPAHSFVDSMNMVRTKAGMPSFGFHDCRHHFVSMCVMSGIDFMTIAAWVGHKDGGVLIGKTYGHLANEHRKAMAQKVNFGPAIVQPAASA